MPLINGYIYRKKNFLFLPPFSVGVNYSREEFAPLRVGANFVSLRVELHLPMKQTEIHKLTLFSEEGVVGWCDGAG